MGAPAPVTVDKGERRAAERPELEFLLTVARWFLGTAEDDDALAWCRRPLDWTRLRARAAAEGMSGLLAVELARVARRHPLDLPLEPFSQALRGNLACNGALFAELSALRDRLRQRGLQAILLKGGALIETVYRTHPGVRPLSDLDLLVRSADVGALVELLRQQGFRPLDASPTVLANGSVMFDLHTDLIGGARIRRRRLAFRFDEAALWRDAIPVGPSDATLVLSPPDQVLHLAVHALKHSFSRLIWVVDLGLVLRHVEWDELVGRAEAAGAARALAYALLAARTLLRVEIPDDVLARLPRPTRVERAFVGRVVSRKVREPLGELVEVFSIPRVGDRLGYLLELGFPRREVLAEVFPACPRWLLPARRALQLVSRGLRALPG